MVQSLYIATPLHEEKVCKAYLGGALTAHSAFAGRIVFGTATGSFLARNRDVLVMEFLRSGTSHLLFVDSDIGWKASDAQALLDTGKPFVSGVYCRRGPERTIPVTLNGKRDGELYGATAAPGGFLLLERACLERMVGAYHSHAYDAGSGFGLAYALFAQAFVPGQPYKQEDKAFCKRWTDIGGEIWIHPRVVVSHHGDATFLPDTVDGVAVLDGRCA